MLKMAAYLLLACGFGNQSRALEAADEKAKPLAEYLDGTKWLWYDKQDQVLEFRKDGTFELAAWAQQGIDAVWEATGPSEVTVTVTSEKFKGLTAILDFNGDRTSFTGTDLDRKRQITRSPRVGAHGGEHSGESEREFADFLDGTRWLWYGKEDQMLEFRKGGKFELGAWKKQGIVAVWKATGSNQVTVKVTSTKFRNLTATLNFNEERTSFTGTDLDKKREISPSPRVGRDDR